MARIVNRTYGEQTFKKSDRDKDLGDELAGTLFAIACMANALDIDLTAAVQKHLDKITKRDVNRFEALNKAD